nr:hypothetical protein [Tanacetum cinerariifolium]
HALSRSLSHRSHGRTEINIRESLFLWGIARWKMLLAEYYIVFKTIKAIRGQALSGDLPVCSGVKAKGRGSITHSLYAMKTQFLVKDLSSQLLKRWNSLRVEDACNKSFIFKGLCIENYILWGHRRELIAAKASTIEFSSRAQVRRMMGSGRWKGKIEEMQWKTWCITVRRQQREPWECDLFAIAYNRDVSKPSKKYMISSIAIEDELVLQGLSLMIYRFTHCYSLEYETWVDCLIMNYFDKIKAISKSNGLYRPRVHSPLLGGSISRCRVLEVLKVYVEEDSITYNLVKHFLYNDFLDEDGEDFILHYLPDLVKITYSLENLIMTEIFEKAFDKRKQSLADRASGLLEGTIAGTKAGL